MEYNFREIEKKWHEYWIANKVYKVEKNADKPKARICPARAEQSAV